MDYNLSDYYALMCHSAPLEFDPSDPEVDLVNQEFDEDDYTDLDVNLLSDDLSCLNLVATRIKNSPEDTAEIFNSFDVPLPFAELLDQEIGDEWCDIHNFADLRIVENENDFEFVSSHITRHLLIVLNSNPNILWTSTCLLAKLSLIQHVENFDVINYWEAMNRRWELMTDELKIGFVFRAFNLKSNQFEVIMKLLGDSLLYPGINVIGKLSMVPMFTVHSIPAYLDHWFQTDDFHSDRFLSFIRFGEITVPKWKKVVVQFYLRQVFSRVRTKVLIANTDVDYWYFLFMKTLVFKSMLNTKNMIKKILNS
uniref:Nonstructural protein P7-2 n=2 Tax=Maize rough dwarf virus TaxID=10989 RepID=A0A650AAY1_MRDV|nr:nonstructural protein P7-2 [Maize rough dwarf virus]QGN19646.1 nonstructural protein P7-2 [Maize rough dwarf virus]QGN19659.1 nonstructural protein P7-2 [Maize rough dwarf virus]QGN19672.1 nonstructural protein P7-2 [Maize rough dwarf virus]QGN19685.1 nonstructural protein P7-2 [Maize rough dwarf virus]